MSAHVQSSTVLGVDGHRVTVEVHVANGLPSFTVVGLPDASCREARDRVRAAVQTSGFAWPQRRVTVNLAPTNLRKVGSSLDLAIAVAVLLATDELRTRQVDGMGFVGELGLDGSVREVPGVLPAVDALDGLRPVVPLESVAEARLVRPDAQGASTLAELVDHASHGDDEGTERILRDAFDKEAEEDRGVYGDADEEDVSEDET